MNQLPFYIVDVFAEEKYAGNQLAVFRHARGLSDETMQSIARETNFSETTFILSDAERDGLGTAYVIRREILQNDVAQVNLNLKLKQIPVTFGHQTDRDLLWMKQKAPDFGPTTDTTMMAEMLGLDPGQIDTRFPIQQVSTGLWFTIVPLVNLNAAKQARVNRDKYFARARQEQGDGILVFCPETYSDENDLNARVFVPYYGIEEDPATGSGNGCLAGYLVKHRYFSDARIDVRVEQGYEIDRPSLIRLKAEEREGTIDVNVGGRVVMVAHGQFT
jgi:trans-2,3-dihydro-3-hydroxyanthranilate isomerase